MGPPCRNRARDAAHALQTNDVRMHSSFQTDSSTHARHTVGTCTCLTLHYFSLVLMHAKRAC